MIWLDAQLSPATAVWLSRTYEVEVTSIRDFGFHKASDAAIFAAARELGAIVITKDADFVALLARHGPLPQVILLRCGNTSNARLKKILAETFEAAMKLLQSGEPLVEITD